MVTTVQAFRAKLSEEITLPTTGLVVKIRRVIADDFVGLGELPMPQALVATPVPLDPSLATSLLRYSHRAIARGVLAPPMTDVLDDGGHPVSSDSVLHVLELYQGCPDDYTFLAQAILQRSGLAPEVATTVDAFHADPLRAPDRGAGGALSLSADDTLSADAARAVPEYAAGADSLG